MKSSGGYGERFGYKLNHIVKNTKATKPTYLGQIDGNDNPEEGTFHILIDGVDTGGIIDGRSYDEALETVYQNTDISDYRSRITIEED